MKDITYYIYHIPGKKIGVTTNLKSRVEDQQGYGPGEYEILAKRYDISEAAKYEAIYQRMYGYPVDIVPYDKLNCNKNKLNMKGILPIDIWNLKDLVDATKTFNESGS